MDWSGATHPVESRTDRTETRRSQIRRHVCSRNDVASPAPVAVGPVNVRLCCPRQSVYTARGATRDLPHRRAEPWLTADEKPYGRAMRAAFVTVPTPELAQVPDYPARWGDSPASAHRPSGTRVYASYARSRGDGAGTCRCCHANTDAHAHARSRGDGAGTCRCCHANTDARAHARPGSDGRGSACRHGCGHPHVHTDPYGDGDSDSDEDAHSHPYTHPHAHARLGSDGRGSACRHGCGHPHVHADPYGDGDSDSDEDAHAHPYAHPHAKPDRNLHSYQNA